MSHHDNHLQDAELGPVIARLEAERPTASDLELGLIAHRVRERVAPSARRSRRTEFMRSRLAIIAMLVSGMLLSTGGGALAVSGLSSTKGHAALQQYGQDNGDKGDKGDRGGEEGGGVLGEENSGGPSGGGGTNPGTTSGGGGEQGVQPARQVEAGAQNAEQGGQLPFTGFAAIPILLGGVALLSAGLILRRRTGERNEG
jgi:hypothetical protein